MVKGGLLSCSTFSCASLLQQEEILQDKLYHFQNCSSSADTHVSWQQSVGHPTKVYVGNDRPPGRDARLFLHCEPLQIPVLFALLVHIYGAHLIYRPSHSIHSHS